MQVNYVSMVPSSVASEYDDTKIAKRLAGWLSIRRELQSVIEIANSIEKQLSTAKSPDLLWLESSTWHLVLRYGRCFDTGAAGRSVAMGAEMVRRLGNDDFYTLHKGLIHRRHNTFAHPGGDCSCRLIVHLLETGAEPHLLVTSDEEAPGAIHDSTQARLVTQLCYALQPAVDEKISRAQAAHGDVLEANREAILRRLRDNAGKHANPSQQAISIMAKILDF